MPAVDDLMRLLGDQRQSPDEQMRQLMQAYALQQLNLTPPQSPLNLNARRMPFAPGAAPSETAAMFEDPALTMQGISLPGFGGKYRQWGVPFSGSATYAHKVPF